MCTAELRAGTLIRLLPDYALAPVEVHAVFPSGPKLSAKNRAFVEFLASELRTSSRAAAMPREQ